MKNHRTLIGGVIVWGLLGVGVYTAVNVAMPYFSKSSSAQESLRTGVNKIKNKIKEVSAKTADKIKKSVVSEAEQEGVPAARQTARKVVSEQKSEDYNSPVKRLGRIADNYMNEESVIESRPENNTAQVVKNGSARIENRVPIAAPEAESNEETVTMHDREQKVFARQLSVIDELLDK